MNPVNWFEIPAKDIKESKAFYDAVFGYDLQIVEMGDTVMAWFPFDPEKPGVTGSLVQYDGYVPSHDGSMVYFSVEDVADYLEKVKSNGGKVVSEKMSIGEYGFVGHFEDVAGNRVGLHSEK